jgi:hypothetical protein
MLLVVVNNMSGPADDGPLLTEFSFRAGGLLAAGEAKATEIVLYRVVVRVERIVSLMAFPADVRGRNTVVVRRIFEVLVTRICVIWSCVFAGEPEDPEYTGGALLKTEAADETSVAGNGTTVTVLKTTFGDCSGFGR